MSAETEVFDALYNSAGVTSLVSSRIYPDVLPEKTAYPAIVFSREKTTPIYSIGSQYFGADVSVQVGCWGKTRTEADSVASAAISALASAGIPHQGLNAGYDPETDLFASVVEVEIFEQ